MARFQNSFANTKLIYSDLFERNGVENDARGGAANHRRKHDWVTVVDPTNQRSLLQACDDCGVVKSENSVMRACRADHGVALISSSSSLEVQIAI